METSDILLKIILIIALFVVTFVVYLLEKEGQRRRLAKKNMSFIESINLTGLPIITFHNGDSVVNMVLDTGSNVCLINKDSLKNLKHEEGEAHAGVMGLEGGTDSGMTVILPLTYKDYEFEFECWATDMQNTINALKQEYGVTIHGILGTGFFMKYKYIIDFNEMIAYSLRKK